MSEERAMRGMLRTVIGCLLIAAAFACAGVDPEEHIRDLYSRDPGIRLKAGNALIRIGRPAVPGLTRELNSPEPCVRFIAAQILGKIRNPEATPALLPLLTDCCESVAIEAAEALGRLGDVRAVPALVQAASDTSPKVRAQAVAALGTCRNDTAYATVLNALEDPDEEVRVMAMLAAQHYAFRGATAQILRLARDTAPRARFVAVQALGEIQDPEREAQIFETLVDALNDPYESVRVKAVRSLGKIGDQRAVPPLTELFISTAGEDRIAAGEVLEELTGRKYIVKN